MKKYVYCKVCGYVMEEDDLKDVCPACGIPKTVFEPYTKKISPQRKFWLDQHLHPIVVHFPQVFLILSLILPLFSLVAPEPLHSELLIAAKLCILILPFSVLAALLSGLIDSKLRFKRLNTPAIVQKIIAAVILQVLSTAIFVLYLASGLTGPAFWVIIGLSLLSIICSIFLGKKGASLFPAFLPG